MQIQMEQDCGREPRAVAGWLLGPEALLLHRGPGGWVTPAPALTLSQRWTLLPVWGTFLSFTEGARRPSSFSSCPVSCGELCRDSARQPGTRPQSPVRLPSLGLGPRDSIPHTHHTTGCTALHRGEKRDTASGPWIHSGTGERPSGILISPPPTPTMTSV